MTRGKTAVSLFGFEPFRIGNGERFARELSVQLGERGWQSVLCFASEPTPEVRRFIEVPNVKIEVVENSWRIDWKPIKSLAAILRKYHPQLLHFHHTGLIGAYPWLARLSSVDRVYYTDQTSNPADFIARRAPLWKRVATRIINYPLTGVVAVSDYGFRTIVTREMVPPSRLRRIYNSIEVKDIGDPERQAADFRRKYSIPPERALVVQVSWIIHEKGIGDLLAAARLVVDARPDTHFAIVGEGADRAQLTAQATALGLADHVTWTGLVQDPYEEGVYAAADVVCQLSRWQEVFGCTITEAMAYNKPLVATNVGGIPELVRDGQTGFLTARNDVPAIAERILRLLNDPPLRERMGEAGRQAAADLFDCEKNVAELIRFYGID